MLHKLIALAVSAAIAVAPYIHKPDNTVKACDTLGMSIHATDVCRHNIRGGFKWHKSPCYYLAGDGIAVEYCGNVMPSRVVK